MTLSIHNTTEFYSAKQAEWKDVRAEFSQVNAELAKIIDNIRPDHTLPLIRVQFRFGDRVIKRGKFMLVEQARESKTCEMQQLAEWLNYSPIPFGIFLKNACEVFMPVQEHIVPLFTLGPGNTIGLFEALDYICQSPSYPVWEVTAGARSLFMLPKINNTIGQKRLKKEFGITANTPTSISDQWYTFVELANTQSDPWRCELMLFTTPWFKRIHDSSIAWTKFREYFFKKCWKMSRPLTEKTFSFLWQQFASSTLKRRFKPRLYILDTMRHLFSLSYSLAAGFAPITHEELGPIALLKKAYVEVYGIQDYAPTFMAPAFLSEETPKIYYSLGYPTLLEGHPEFENTRNTIADLKEIKLLMTNMREYCSKQFGHQGKFQDFLTQIHFDYFHKVLDIEKEIQLIDQLPLQDPLFHDTLSFANKQTFCTSAPFFNGCIKIERTD